ncbi:hypothetical protein [Brucella cytisi]|uniref:Uncharacterized protein n=1 Tax=Brucella cytisi TaxID=407152 RepID=A0A1J6I5V9_9HYPH|nr:hypothetical protein [Brucella cytisi]OIS90320.1 hypothetical protein BLA27_27405 [Brucella cytisi]
MEFSTDDQLREALRKMADVLAYLERLPPVPVTRELCRDLAAFLDAPTSRLVLDHESPRRGSYYSAAGLPLLDAELRGDTLTVRLPSPPSPRLFDPDGLTVQLKRADA